MKASLNCINLISHYEGCRLTSYLCPSGIWTIGVGHTGCVDGKKFGAKLSIDKVKAYSLLEADLKAFELTLNKYIKVKINQNQFDALLSLTFNIGAGAFIKSTVLRELNAGRYSQAAKAIAMWNKGSNKQVLNGLVKRRQSEITLFNTGELKFY